MIIQLELEQAYVHAVSDRALHTSILVMIFIDLGILVHTGDPWAEIIIRTLLYVHLVHWSGWMANIRTERIHH